MNLFNRASKALGLQLASNILNAAVVSQKGKHIVIEKLLSQDVQDLSETDLSPFLATAALISATTAQETLVRALEIKLKKEKEIDSVLSFQTEPLIPYPIEEAILDKIILGNTPDGTQLTVLAIKKAHLKNHLEQLKHLQIDPEVTTATPLALAAFSAYLLPAKPPHFVLYLDQDQICCIFVRGGKLIASQASRFTCEPAETSAEAELQQAVQRLLFSLMKQVKELQIPHILLTGQDSIRGIPAEQLLAKIQKQLLIAEPISEISLQKILPYAIPIGAALIALASTEDAVNFRQQDFAYPNPWKKWRRPFCLYFATCLATAIGLWLFKIAYVGAVEDEIRQSYARLLQQTNLSHTALETKPSSADMPASAAVNLKLLTAEDIQQRISKLEKELQSAPDIFPLHPNVPRVSDLLAWLASHPKATNSEGKALIQLESFSYTMLKRPDSTKKQEKYQVKVEFEFTSLNPTIAREFHEALLAPNDFVDPKLELKWSSEKSKYKAIFFVKDKTSYL